MADYSKVKNRLLKEYLPDMVGMWAIYGEDSNCDLGGPHHEPHLETVTGTYKNVVEYALTLPNFFTWGYGGCIIRKELPENLINVDNLKSQRVTELECERAKLQFHLKEIEKEIQTLIRKK